MTVPLEQDSEAKSFAGSRILRKRFYIFFVARDEAGQLRKITIPVQYLYVLLAGAAIGALCLTRVHVALGWRGLPAHDDDRWALAVLLHVLGDGPSSRLYREVRDEAKYHRLVAFGHALPKIRKAVDRDLDGPGLSRRLGSKPGRQMCSPADGHHIRSLPDGGLPETH